MNCFKCHNILPEDARFCDHCGEPQPVQPQPTMQLQAPPPIPPELLKKLSKQKRNGVKITIWTVAVALLLGASVAVWYWRLYELLPPFKASNAPVAIPSGVAVAQPDPQSAPKFEPYSGAALPPTQGDSDPQNREQAQEKARSIENLASVVINSTLSTIDAFGFLESDVEVYSDDTYVHYLLSLSRFSNAHVLFLRKDIERSDDPISVAMQLSMFEYYGDYGYSSAELSDLNGGKLDKKEVALAFGGTAISYVTVHEEYRVTFLASGDGGDDFYDMVKIELLF